MPSPSELKARAAAPPDPDFLVSIARGVGSSIAHLPGLVGDIFGCLYDELHDGPTPAGWPALGRLMGQKGQQPGEKRYYCHIATGRPTYVVCWRQFRGSTDIEVYYAGTHGKAPYW